MCRKMCLTVNGHILEHVERHAHSWRHVVCGAMCPSVKALLTVTVSLLEIAVKDRIATQSDKQYKLQRADVAFPDSEGNWRH